MIILFLMNPVMSCPYYYMAAQPNSLTQFARKLARLAWASRSEIRGDAYFSLFTQNAYTSNSIIVDMMRILRNIVNDDKKMIYSTLYSSHFL